MSYLNTASAAHEHFSSLENTIQPYTSHSAFINGYQTFPQNQNQLINQYGTRDLNPINSIDLNSLAAGMASNRDWNTGQRFCEGRLIEGQYIFDTFGREGNLGSVSYQECPGYSPLKAMDREQHTQRMEFVNSSLQEPKILPKGILM